MAAERTADPKLAVVVGANRGIGLALVEGLLVDGHRVVAACRTPSDALSALDGVEIVADVDVTEDAGVARLADALGDRVPGILLCNAGVLQRTTLDALDLDAIRWQLEVNALGPLRVVAGLRSRLGRGSRVGIVTSRMGSIADNTSGSHYGYRMSKAAVNMAGVSLAHDLRDAGVAVALLHPGYVRTDMTGGRGNLEPRESAAGLLARMAELDLERSGTFWHAQGEVLPW